MRHEAAPSAHAPSADTQTPPLDSHASSVETSVSSADVPVPAKPATERATPPSTSDAAGLAGAQPVAASVAPLPTFLFSLEKGWDAPQEQALALAVALRASGRHAVRLCCPADGELGRRARACCPSLEMIPVSAGHPLLSLFRLWRCQQGKSPLLLHAFDAAALQLAWRLVRLRRAGGTLLLHSCLTLPSSEAESGAPQVRANSGARSGLLGPMPTEAENKAWQAAEAIFCANAHLRSLLVDSGLNAGRLVVVHPGCHTAALPARQPRTDGRFVFVAVENLCQGAGLFVLLRAMAALWQRTDLAPWEVRVVGAGEAMGALLDEARSLGVESRLALLSRQDLSEVLPRCDAMVVPHRLPMGNIAALMAAWCCELPLVCTDLGPHREVVRAESTALSVPSGDAQALAAAMIRLMGDPALSAALSAQGAGMRAYADHARMVTQTLARYEHCLGSHGWVLPPALAPALAPTGPQKSSPPAEDAPSS